MSRTERIIVAVAIAIICPATLFFLLWWISAALSICHLLPISESSIAVAAVSGLCLGALLDIFYLKRWIPKFYRVNTTLTVLLYLFWSAIAVALLMGLPFLNLAWGICAGLYVGRKHRHIKATAGELAKAARYVGIFTALITGLEALAVGLLSLREGVAQTILAPLTGLQPSAIKGPPGVLVIGLLCTALMAMQFWCTRTAATWAFRARISSQNPLKV